MYALMINVHKPIDFFRFCFLYSYKITSIDHNTVDQIRIVKTHGLETKKVEI